MIFFNFRNLVISSVFMAAASAQAETVVIVNKANNNLLTEEQTANIFMAKTKAYPNGDASIAIDLPKGETRDEFYAKVADKNRNQMKAYWSQQIFTGTAQPPKEVSTEKEAVEFVAKTPNAIGYVEKTKVNNKVKVLFVIP